MFVLFVACKKENRQVIMDKSIAGRLMYVPAGEVGNTPRPLAARQVKIAASPSDTLNFLFQTTTDKDGYFVWSSLRAAPYLLFFDDVIDGVKYSAVRNIEAGNDSIVLMARPDSIRQNGLRVIVTDPSGGRVNGASLCFFNNATAASADTCIGSLFSLTANAEGIALGYKLSAGVYYTIASAVIGGKYHKGRGIVTVSANGVTQSSLTLAPVTPTGIEFRIQDPFATPANAAKVCLFTSYAQFLNADCAASINNGNADAEGKFFVTGLKAGRYYYRVSMPGFKYENADSVDVSAGMISVKTVRLQ